MNAIETDVSWGVYSSRLGTAQSKPQEFKTEQQEQLQAIAAHPPTRSSDLSMHDLLREIMVHNTTCHLKLDFKHEPAVVPTLRLVRQLLCKDNFHGSEPPADRNPCRRTLFLNADLVPGPGVAATSDVDISPHMFWQACREELFLHPEYCHRSNKKSVWTVAFSLGWKVDLADYATSCWRYYSFGWWWWNDRWGTGYGPHHVQALQPWILQFAQAARPEYTPLTLPEPVPPTTTTTTSIPIVLALHGRLLSLSPSSTWHWLHQFLNHQQPQPSQANGRRCRRQVLIWTATGEPPMGRSTTHKFLNRHFPPSDKVGYDVLLTDSIVMAWIYNVAVILWGCKQHVLQYLATGQPPSPLLLLLLLLVLLGGVVIFVLTIG